MVFLTIFFSSLPLKAKVNYLLFLCGRRSTIPAAIVNAVKIEENGEEMVDIRQIPGIFLSENLSARRNVYLRRGVAEKLGAVLKMLPQGVHLKIYSAFRSMDEQYQNWNRIYAQNRARYPDADEAEITLKTKAKCADPRKGFGGHQTGGAIDLSLCDAAGNDLDMGTAYGKFNRFTPTACSDVSPSIKENRLLLLRAMQSVGFVNYPQEWWHYCYGDRMWAAYTQKNKCFYGLAAEPKEKE